ncbi:MAG: Gfo/Idh/MocA family oxidoreductase [Actinomycetota bacterium]
MSPPLRPTQSLKVAVVGTGGISEAHLAFLSGRSSVGPVDDRVDLRAVCDLSPVAARYAASAFGVPAHYTDLDELLAVEQPDVVHVLTPPNTHVPLATACLKSGADVICEKPITATAYELVDLLATADGLGRRVMESHNYRFNPTIRQMGDAVIRGDLGVVREVDIRIALPVTNPNDRFGDPNLPSPIHSMPAGVIHDFTTHLTYLLLHFAGGATFDRVSAAWSRHGDNEIFTVDDLDALLIGEGPDGAVHGRLRFDARTSPDLFSVTVRGSEGYAETDLFHPFLRVVKPRPGGSKLSPVVNHLVNGAGQARAGFRNLSGKIMQQGPLEGMHHMLDLAYHALVSGGDLPVSTDDMLGASRLVDLMLGEEVRL